MRLSLAGSPSARLMVVCDEPVARLEPIVEEAHNALLEVRSEPREGLSRVHVFNVVQRKKPHHDGMPPVLLTVRRPGSALELRVPVSVGP